MSFSRTILASSLMILTAIYLNFGTRSEVISPLKGLSEFPTVIGRWKGHVSHFDEDVYKTLGVDDSYLCNYQSEDGKSIQLYIGFYQSQREGALIHSPKNCMPGAGWDIINRSLIKVNMSPRGQRKVIRLLMRKGNERQIALYWFQSRGRVISSEYWQKIYLIWDSIFKHRTDGTFVRLIAPVEHSEAETTCDLKGFAQDLFPILEQFLPGA